MSVYSSATVKLEMKETLTNIRFGWKRSRGEMNFIVPDPVNGLVVPVVAVSATSTITHTHTVID